MKIHIGDMVSGTGGAVIDGYKLESFYQVVGAKRVGELSEFGGLWILR